MLLLTDPRLEEVRKVYNIINYSKLMLYVDNKYAHFFHLVASSIKQVFYMKDIMVGYCILLKYYNDTVNVKEYRVLKKF